MAAKGPQQKAEYCEREHDCEKKLHNPMGLEGNQQLTFGAYDFSTQCVSQPPKVPEPKDAAYQKKI